jgi:hypothetical protein
MWAPGNENVRRQTEVTAGGENAAIRTTATWGWRRKDIATGRDCNGAEHLARPNFVEQRS